MNHVHLGILFATLFSNTQAFTDKEVVSVIGRELGKLLQMVSEMECLLQVMRQVLFHHDKWISKCACLTNNWNTTKNVYILFYRSSPVLHNMEHLDITGTVAHLIKLKHILLII